MGVAFAARFELWFCRLAFALSKICGVTFATDASLMMFVPKVGTRRCPGSSARDFEQVSV